LRNKLLLIKVHCKLA